MRLRARSALPLAMATLVACGLSSGGCSSKEPVEDPAFEADWTEDFENDTVQAAAEEADQAELDQLDDNDDVEVLTGEDTDDSTYENAPFDQTELPAAGPGVGGEGQPPGAINPSLEDHPGPVDYGVDEDGVEIPPPPAEELPPSPLVLKGTPPKHDKHGPLSIIEDDPWFSAQTWMADGTFTYDVDLATKRVGEAKALGAKVLRVMLMWSGVAPDPKNTVKPAFVSSQPGGYDWRGLDAQIIAARRNGMKVLITATAGNMPFWASEEPDVCKSRVVDLKSTWSCSYKPKPIEYAKFVTAIGRHIKQRHFPIWGFTLVNEPNIGAFLTDEDSKNDGDKNSQMETAFRYRRLWFAGRKALLTTAKVRTRVFFSDQANNQKTKGEHLTPASARWNLLDWSLCLHTEWNPDLLSGKYKCPLSPRKAVCHGVAFHPYASSAGQASYSVQFLERLVDDAAEAGRLPKGRGLYMTEGGFLTGRGKGGAALGASATVTPTGQAIAINGFDRFMYEHPRVKTAAQYELLDEGRGTFDCGLRYAWGDVHLADADKSVVTGNFLQVLLGTRVVVRTADNKVVTILWKDIAPAPWDANTKWHQRVGAGAEKPAYAAYRVGIAIDRAGDDVRIFGHARFDTGLGFTIDGLYPEGWHEITVVKTDELGYGEKTLPIGKAKAWRIHFGPDYSRVAK